jgi:hypothetical protein
MIYDLMCAIQAVLQAAFSHPQFISDQAPHAMDGAAVHVGQLPFKRATASQNDFPYLLIQPAKGEDEENNAAATIHIHCGVFNNESGNEAGAGANDLVNMLDRVRRTIKAQRFVGDGDRYHLEMPIKWRYGGEEDEHLQPLPMNEGVVITTWSMPTVVDVPGGDVQAALGVK